MSTASARDYFRLYRVRDWVHFLPLPLAGWFSSSTHDPGALIGGVLGWALALAYTSAMNQAFDDRLDRAQPDKNPVGVLFNRRQAVLLALPAAAASIVVVALLSRHCLEPLFVLLIAATLYSAPPRLKRVPVLGTLWNLVVGLPGLFLAGRPSNIPAAMKLFVGLFALLLIVSQLIHEAEDREDDRVGGIATVATLTGTRGALAAAAVFLLVTPGAVWWLARGLTARDWLTACAALFAGVWTVMLVLRIGRENSSALRLLRLRYRYSAFVLGAVVYLAVAQVVP